jgi:hypothetical protein
MLNGLVENSVMVVRMLAAANSWRSPLRTMTLGTYWRTSRRASRSVVKPAQVSAPWDQRVMTGTEETMNFQVTVLLTCDGGGEESARVMKSKEAAKSPPQRPT